MTSSSYAHLSKCDHEHNSDGTITWYGCFEDLNLLDEKLADGYTAPKSCELVETGSHTVAGAAMVNKFNVGLNEGVLFYEN
jgi:hypothetical protein